MNSSFSYNSNRFPYANLQGNFGFSGQPGFQVAQDKSQSLPGFGQPGLNQMDQLNQAFGNSSLGFHQPQFSVVPTGNQNGFSTGSTIPGNVSGNFDSIDSSVSTLLSALTMSLMTLITKLSKASKDGSVNPSEKTPKPEKPETTKQPEKNNPEKTPQNKKPAEVNPAPTPEKKPPPSSNNDANARVEKVNGGGPNEMVLKNTDSKPMTIGLFENTGPGLSPNLKDPNYKFTLQPGETLKVAMPDNWQGRAQKLGGNPLDPASWAEINYSPENGGNRLWYNLSLIRGYNSAVTLKPTHATDDSQLAGSSKSIIDEAPPEAVTTDAGGNKVIKDTETFTGTLNQGSIDYLNKAVGNKAAYVRFNDDGAVRTTTDRSLTVTFGAA